jgi:hypothetical protein
VTSTVFLRLSRRAPRRAPAADPVLPRGTPDAAERVA